MSQLKGMLVHRLDNLDSPIEAALIANAASQMKGKGIEITTPYDCLTVGEYKELHPTVVYRRLVQRLMDMNFLIIIHSTEMDLQLDFLKHAAIAAGIERLPAERFIHLQTTPYP